MEYDIEINAKEGSIFKLEKEAFLNSSNNNTTSNNRHQKVPNKV